MKALIVGFFLMSIGFISCQSEFDYKPLASVRGKHFQIISFNVQNRGTLKDEEINLGDKSEIYFSDCSSQNDIPCEGSMILNGEVINFTFGTSYTASGIFIQGTDTTMKEFPKDLPSLILTGDYNVDVQKKGEYILRGTVGFKKNYPSILATHSATLKLRKE